MHLAGLLLPFVSDEETAVPCDLFTHVGGFDTDFTIMFSQQPNANDLLSHRVDALESMLMTNLPRIASLEHWKRDIWPQIDTLERGSRDVKTN